MVTSGSITACSTWQKECTRTSEKSTELATCEPDTMQPPEITMLTATPCWPVASGTNLAGGNCRCEVQIGQSSS